MADTTRDRIVKALFDEHRINLLRLPRTGIEPGQVLMLAANGTDTLGPVALAALLEGSPSLPSPPPAQKAGDISLVWSNVREAKGHIGIFGKLLAVFLPGLATARLAVDGKAGSSAKFRFRFAETMQESIDLVALRRLLDSAKADLGSYATLRLFVIVDVFKSKDLALEWFDDSGNAFSAEAALATVAEVSGGRTSRIESESKVVVSTTEPLAFGVRLIELELKQPMQTFSAKLDYSYIAVRGGAGLKIEDLVTLSKDGFLDLPLHP